MRQYTTLLPLMIAALGALSQAALAQSPPAATTTFTAGGDNLWPTVGNWDVQVPLVSDDALIGAGETASWDQTVDGDPAFGTLTLGAGATLQYKANGNEGLPSGATAYFGDGSHFQLTAGTINRGATYYIVPGASVQFTLRDNCIVAGTYSGSGDLLNIVIPSGRHFCRQDASAFTGELRYTASSGNLRVYLASQGGAIKLGPGLSTFEDNISLRIDSANHMHDSGTVKLVDSPYGTEPKLYILSRTDTIGDFIVESPSASSPVFRRDSGGVLTVSNDVLFQGTAGTAELDDTQATPAGNGLVAANMTFAGTGTWTLSGDCNISLSAGGIMSNDTAATVSAPLNATSGLTKAGTQTLTVSDYSGILTETILEGGSIIVGTTVTFAGTDYITFATVLTSFTATFGGSFANIAAVESAMNDTSSFRMDPGLDGARLAATDNGDSTFTVEAEVHLDGLLFKIR